MRYILGIDPGAAGAWAVISDRGAYVAAWDAPRSIDDTVDLCGDVLRRLRVECPSPQLVAYLERAFAMSGQRSGDYMMLFGAAQTILSAHGVPRHLVSANRWKRDLDMPAIVKPPKGTPPDEASVIQQRNKRAAKEHSRAFARRLFPDAELQLQKHDGRAEALLIAEWGRLFGGAK